MSPKHVQCPTATGIQKYQKSARVPKFGSGTMQRIAGYNTNVTTRVTNVNRSSRVEVPLALTDSLLKFIPLSFRARLPPTPAPT